MHQHLNYRGCRRNWERARVWENIWRDLGKFFTIDGGKETVNEIPEVQRMTYKEKHSKTHINQTNKN